MIRQGYRCTSSRKVIMSVLLMALFLTPAAWVFSNTSKDDVVGKVFSKFEKIQTYILREKLKQRLDLSDRQISQITDILGKTNARRAQLFRERVQIVDLIEKNKPIGADLDNALAKIDEIDGAMMATEKERRSELRAVVSPEQRAKFILFKREVARNFIDFLKPLL